MDWDCLPTISFTLKSEDISSESDLEYQADLRRAVANSLRSDVSIWKFKL